MCRTRCVTHVTNTVAGHERQKGTDQNPYIEEQTTQWPKEKVQKDKQRSTKHTYKAKDRVTRTPLKTGGDLSFLLELILFIGLIFSFILDSMIFQLFGLFVVFRICLLLFIYFYLPTHNILKENKISNDMKQNI
jgi:Ca2+-dependent lipid-binding protein